MDPSRYATLRSVLIDGSSRARIEGTPVALAISRDGRHACVTHRSYEHDTEMVTRVSLEDGRVERLAAGRRSGLRGQRWFVSGEGRILDALPEGGTLAWRDLDGRSRAVPYRDGDVVNGVTPDGAWLVRTRFEGPTTSLHVLRFDDGAERSSSDARAFVGKVFSSGDAFVAFVTSQGLARLRLDDGDLRSTTLPGSSAWMMIVERGGAHVACSNRSQVLVFELASLREVARFATVEHSLLCDFVGGRLLLIEVTERENSYVVREVDGGAAMPWRDVPHGTSAALTPDGARAVYVRDGVLRVGDVVSGRHAELHDGPDSFTSAMTWSHDGALLAAVGRDNAVRVLDTRSGALVWAFEGQRPGRREVVAPHARFTPDGRALLLASRLGLTLWSLSTGEELARTPWEESSLDFDSVALSPDGRLLAIASMWMGGETGVTLLDLLAEMRVVTRWTLPQVTKPRRSWLRFEGAETLRWSVVNADGRGQVTSYRLSLDGTPSAPAVGQLRESAKAIPLDGDERWIVVDRSSVSVAPTTTDGDLTGRLLDGLRCLAPLDARAGVAAISVRIDGEASASLAIYDFARGRVLGVARCARSPVGATLSPGGTHVAVRYGDGAFEVFAIERG